MAKRKAPSPAALVPAADYDGLLRDVVSLLETARHTAARAINAVMTATYWEVGRRIVEVEQRGAGRADYGKALLQHLGSDLSSRFGRGFSERSLYKMRLFYLYHPEISPTLSAEFVEAISPTLSAKSSGLPPPIQRTSTVDSLARTAQTPSAKSVSEKFQTSSGKLQTASATSGAGEEGQAERVRRLAARFPLPWSHYVRLLSVKDEDARRFHRRLKRGG